MYLALYYCTWFLLLLAVSYRVHRLNMGILHSTALRHWRYMTYNFVCVVLLIKLDVRIYIRRLHC